MTRDLRTIVPEMRNSTDNLQLVIAMHKKAQLLCEEILNGVDNSKAIAELTDTVLDSIKPLCLQSGNEKNAILQMETAFEELCAVLRLEGITHPEQLTVFAFHMQIKVIKQRAKPRPEKQGHNGQAPGIY